MKKVIITGKAHEHLEQSLRGRGYEVIYDPGITAGQLEDLIGDAEGIVVTTRIPVNRSLLEKAPALKWIGRLGSGMELIDTEYARSRGIECVSSPEGNREAVAEHALALLLCLFNNIIPAANEVRKGSWSREPNRGIELAGKTVGIIGFGNTGSSLARLLRSFDVTLLAYDKYRLGYGDEFVNESTPAEIAASADIISFHVPLTPETYHLANAEFFMGLGKKPWILNTSRGKVVELDALIAALQSNRISGAALDVLENENLDSYSSEERQQLSWLLSRDNVIITPHIAGYSHEALFKMAEVLLQKLPLSQAGSK